VVVGAVAAAAAAWFGLRARSLDVRLPSFIQGRGEPEVPSPRPAQPVAVLRREVGSLRGLVSSAARGELMNVSDTRALIAVHQGLVEALIRAQLPSSHVVAQRFRVVVKNAHVTFEDGLALVRLEGRVSVEEAPDVYADLTVYGDLHLVPRDDRGEALRLRITVTAVEARRVEVGVRTREADRLVEEIGRAQAQEFAALAPDVDVPVRWEYEVVIPGLGPRGPVDIDEARLRVGLRIHEVRALGERLWMSVDMDVDPVRSGKDLPPEHTTPAEAVEESDVLRAEHERLHRTLAEHLAKHPVLAPVIASRGDVTFVVPSGLFTMLGEEIAVRYLDRVNLALEGIRVDKDGEIHSNTALGKLHSGDWKLRVDLDQVRGVLRAGRPRIALREGGRISVAVPVHIEQGQGRAALHFAWDSRGLAKIVCRDFEVRESVAGAVVKETHALEGQVTLEARGDDLRLRPRFERRHRIHVAPSAEAWATVESALDRQDKFFRCGLALKQDAVMARLQGIVERGFVVKLPESLFREVRLPSVLAGDVHVADREVQVATRETVLTTDARQATLSLRLRITLPGGSGGEAVEGTAGTRRPH
jgi:hypothetical protein